MRKLDFTRDLLLILFVVYYAQGSLYPQGSFVSQSALGLILIISIYFFVQSIFSKSLKSNFFKAWTALLLLNILGFILTASLSNALHFSMFKGLMMSLLPFYPFYYFSQKKNLKAKHLIRFFLLMLPITILQFYFNADQIRIERGLSGNANLVNNVAYSFVALIPFAFLFKQKKIVSIAAMLILMFFIVQGAKRGALLAGFIGLVFFIYFQLRTVEKKNRFKGYLLVVIGVLVLGYFGFNFYVENEYLAKRIQSIGEGNTSGRNVIYSNIFDYWTQSNSYFSLLFGFGFAASLKMGTNNHFAHNDWLELLSNFGLLGVSIYAFLFYSSIKQIRILKLDTDKRIVILAIVSIWFFITLVSMSYISSNGYIQAILLAYLIGSKSNSLE